MLHVVIEQRFTDRLAVMGRGVPHAHILPHYCHTRILHTMLKHGVPFEKKTVAAVARLFSFLFLSPHASTFIRDTMPPPHPYLIHGLLRRHRHDWQCCSDLRSRCPLPVVVMFARAFPIIRHFGLHFIMHTHFRTVRTCLVVFRSIFSTGFWVLKLLQADTQFCAARQGRRLRTAPLSRSTCSSRSLRWLSLSF